MVRGGLLSQILNFLFYILAQVILVKNLVLFDTAFCFIYVAFLLLLPFEIGILVILLLGFITGFLVDVFYNSLGIHTAACVLMAYLRTYLIRFLTPRGGYEAGAKISLNSLGLRWFSSYCLVLIFIHHFTMFFLELGGFELFFFTLFKIITSTFLTFIVIVIVQYLSGSIYSRRM